ncbi:MAG TPA: hypothetical protein ENJ50_10285 [Planctomycetaceae bacterium]|nr:hypothetical protein [Planctomycetaceae bacterium]
MQTLRPPRFITWPSSLFVAGRPGLPLLLCTLLVGVGSFAARAFAEATWFSQPQRGTVQQNTAIYYSGPTRLDYPCGELAKGVSVDIYGTTDDGWLAIRPPDDAFSWVLAERLQPTGDPGLYRVAHARTVAWIGSRLETPHHYRWQVQLRPGDTVVVQNDRPENAPVEGAPSWRRIEPPSGEFRWIRQEVLEPAPVAQAAHWKHVDSRGEGHSNEARIRREPRRWTEPEATPIPKDRLFDGSSPVQPASALSGEARDQLVALKAALASELAQDPARWQLEPLLARAQRLAGESEAEVRREALAVEASITRLQQWRREAERIQTSGRLALAMATESTETDSLKQLEFDGVGYLVPVHSSRQGVPPFALLDDQNKMVALVRARPGLRLHRYANRRVGIYGSQRENGTTPPLLTARRVVVLSDDQ